MSPSVGQYRFLDKSMKLFIV